ncbi:MAG: response regulator [Sedimenticola sp.]
MKRVLKQYLLRKTPDLILMDWMLSGKSGVELKQSELTRDIPVIMLTARGEEDDKARCLECVAEDYVTISFSPPN